MAGDLIEISTNGVFTLYERPAFSKEGWKNLKLIRAGKAKKNNWWLGWNGERLAVNFDEQKLKTHEPEIWQWVFDELKSRFPGVQP